jgi:hypothetical protein
MTNFLFARLKAGKVEVFTSMVKGQPLRDLVPTQVLLELRWLSYQKDRWAETKGPG